MKRLIDRTMLMTMLTTLLTTMLTAVLAMLTAAVLAVPTLLAQTPAQAAPEKSSAVIQAGTEEVLLDVIVRDKHGKAVTDLTPQDFEVTDNGEKHAVKSFLLVQGGEAVAAGASQRTQLD